MAALGTIRKRGVILVCIISFGLFAFIAEEAFRSCDSAKNNERQQVGEVLGEKISVQDFQKLVDEYTEVIKMQQGQDNLPEEQMNQVKDMVWNTYIQNKIVANEAEKLGLTVTDAELQDILKTGTNPMLQQTPFVNQQTGRFDASALQKFLSDYKAQKANPSANAQMMEQYDKIFKYWSFIEKTLRQQTLAQKYQSLLAHCFLSNPVEAKMAFKEENEESKIQLAAFPYSDIQDDKVKVDDSELKAKYDELKARFKQPVESRDIKYVDVNGDGVIDADDRGYFGLSNRPHLTYGLNLNFTWNGFDFNAQFTGGALFDVSLTGTYYNGYDDNTIWTQTFKEGGNSPLYLVQGAYSEYNKEGTYPRLTLSTTTHGGDNGVGSTFWIRDGKYLRLKTAQLGYTLPKKVTDLVGISSLRLFVEGQNLFTWDGLPEGIDPESPGVNNGYYPQQRLVMGGITLTF